MQAKEASQRVSQNPTRKVLRGQTREEGVMLYLERIQKDVSDTDSDIEGMVKQHGRDAGIRVLSARAVRNRFCDYTVGCRITVPLSQIDAAMCVDCWPDGIKCRKWEAKRRTQRNPYRSKSDDNNGRGDRGTHSGQGDGKTSYEAGTQRGRDDKAYGSQRQDRHENPCDGLQYEDLSADEDRVPDNWDQDESFQDMWRCVREEQY